MRWRTVTLELVRSGPGHNQLLSPTTTYLALCGNHSPESVHVPFEHANLLELIGDLRYQGNEQMRIRAMRDMRRMVRDILGQIQHLRSEIASAAADGSAIQLRLVLSASELSLIPFEVAFSPPGFRGEIGRDLVETTAPITITRASRRVGPSRGLWPDVPRILVAATDLPNFAPVPLREHLLALQKVLSPWAGGAWDSVRFQQFVTVLPAASIGQIRDALSRRQYTHVHILAHGIEMAGRGRYGIALHDERASRAMATIDGETLGGALRTFRRHQEGELAAPSVVTLASCDTGNPGSIMMQGGSIAHDLHDAGVPVVIASQFPLTMVGSVTMVQELYRRLLWGEDPQSAVVAVRQQLAIECRQGHDWASLVVYAALPTDIRSQLRRARLAQAKRSANAALMWADRDAQGSAPRNVSADDPSLYGAMIRAMRRLRRVKPRGSGPLARAQRIDMFGLLGGLEKRWAEKVFHSEKKPATASSTHLRPDQHWTYWIELARDHYKAVLDEDDRVLWAMVQWLVLATCLRFWQSRLDPKLPDEARDWLAKHLKRAEALAQVYVSTEGCHAQARERIEGYRASIELVILRSLLDAEEEESLTALAVKYATAFMREPGVARLDQYALVRQLHWYSSWWKFGKPVADAALAAILKLGAPQEWTEADEDRLTRADVDGVDDDEPMPLIAVDPRPKTNPGISVARGTRTEVGNDLRIRAQERAISYEVLSTDTLQEPGTLDRAIAEAGGMTQAHLRIESSDLLSGTTSDLLTVEAPATPDTKRVLLTTDGSGGLHWHFAEPKLSMLDGGPSVDQFVIPFHATTSPGVELLGDVGTAVGRIIKVVDFPLSTLITNTGVAWLAKWEEKARSYHLRKFLPATYTAESTDAEPWQELTGERALLFIHGTFSRSHEAFGAIDKATMTRLAAAYGDRVFALDHFTLTDDPQKTVDWFIQRLPISPCELDIVSHSRGGLVARLLARAPGIRVRRSILVGVPNRGTPLVDTERMGALVDIFTNLLDGLPDTIALNALSAVVHIVRAIATNVVDGLVGLQAMRGGGPLIAQLDGSAEPGQLFSIASAFSSEFSRPALAAAALAAKAAFGESNDLVVPTLGASAPAMASIESTSQIHYGELDHVDHISYFHPEKTFGRTSKALVEWLCD